MDRELQKRGIILEIIALLPLPGPFSLYYAMLHMSEQPKKYVILVISISSFQQYYDICSMAQRKHVKLITQRSKD
jgi:hypothetical protein